MHIIVICIDSLRQDHVSFYAGERSPVRTSYIDAFAEEAVVFDNVYPDALPTIPIRTQLMTGQRTLGLRSWQPLQPTDRTLAEILADVGYVNALITDVYHYFKPGYNFHRGFHVWRWIRGQEYDNFRTQPLHHVALEQHTKEIFPDGWSDLIVRSLRNIASFETADDYFCAQVIREAVTWLEENHRHEKIFLWLDLFDPHEPWVPPPEFDKYTEPDYSGKRIILPPGGQARAVMTDDEISHTRGLYAGEVAYVDECIGKLLTKVRELELYNESLIVLLSDHGHPLADHGKFLKGADRLYNELLKVPFMIRFPEGEYGGRRITSLAQFQDVLPTLLDLVDVAYDAEAFHGRTLAGLLRGESSENGRETIITGYHDGIDRCIRTERWSLIQRPAGESDELYDLLADPPEQENLIDRHSDVAAELRGRFGGFYSSSAGLKGQRGLQGRFETAAIVGSHRG